MNTVMQGKRGLIMGVANNHSIAWGCAQALHSAGAELAFTFQGSAFERRVRPLAESLGANLVMDADVQDEDSLDRVFEALKSEWGSIDFTVQVASAGQEKQANLMIVIAQSP
mgnify:CR=1 FL=1